MSEGRRVHLIIDPPLSEAARRRLLDVPRGMLRDLDTDELLISATLEYINDSIVKHKLALVRVTFPEEHV